MSPRVNPKNPQEIAFVSGRGGLPQVYRMTIDGTDVARLSAGDGEAVQPAWHPDGKLIVAEVGRTIQRLKQEKQSTILVEQNLKLALDLLSNWLCRRRVASTPPHG